VDVLPGRVRGNLGFDAFELQARVGARGCRRAPAEIQINEKLVVILPDGNVPRCPGQQASAAFLTRQAGQVEVMNARTAAFTGSTRASWHAFGGEDPGAGSGEMKAGHFPARLSGNRFGWQTEAPP